MSRRNLVDRLVALVGADIVSVVDPRDGWPSLIRIRLNGEDLPAAVHLGPIGLSHRNRDDVERRLQNPGQGHPVTIIEPFFSLVIGIWEEENRPVLAGMEAEGRLGRGTRQSLFIPLWLLRHAAQSGWAEHYSTSGELIIAFHPALLPTYVEARRSHLRLDSEQVTSILEASGLTAPPEERAAERARRASTALVRSAKFGKNVVDAYGGLCALCGLNFGLVQGAHIYPVHAPFSVDLVWNGLALCSNHHAAFDRHLLWIEPRDRSVKLHPRISSGAEHDEAARRFSEMTFPQLRSPLSSRNTPRTEMFERRYDFFGEEYSWVKATRPRRRRDPSEPSGG